MPYIAASLAGVLALGLLLIQPLLAMGWLPGARLPRLRRWHRLAGTQPSWRWWRSMSAGLLIASPPDAIDALLLRSPTPFSVWGVAAMWAVAATAVLVALRRRVRLRPVTWAALHNALALVVVLGTVIHAVQIEGTMGTAQQVGAVRGRRSGPRRRPWRGRGSGGSGERRPERRLVPQGLRATPRDPDPVADPMSELRPSASDFCRARLPDPSLDPASVRMFGAVRQRP